MTLVIFPDGTVMLFDCNVTTSNEAEILGLLDQLVPEQYNEEKELYEKPIHIFVNSHRDEDHYRGLKKVNEKFPIRRIWDSGQAGATTGSADYQYYMRLRRTLKAKDPNNLIVPVPSNIEMANYGGAKVHCLAAEQDFVKDYANETFLKAEAKIQHTNSMVLLIEYGDKKLLMTGDSDWKSWRDKIVPNFNEDGFLGCNILVASHHGSRSFFTDEANDTIDIAANPDTTYIESIELIHPDITLISCGDYSSAHHPNKEALDLYKVHTSEAQVYTTHAKGHMSGFIDSNGNFTVAPTRFSHDSNAPPSIGFNIRCEKRNGSEAVPVLNNSSHKIGCHLEFSISTFGGLIEPYNKVEVYWEVSNGGQGDDSAHQEIYHKGKNESTDSLSFYRELSYVGTHLLRCRVKNRHKRYDITRVFVAKGIE